MTTPPESQTAASAVFSGLLARVKGMLLQPAQTWPLVAAEDDSIARVYKSYLVWLLLIPSVAAFIGSSIVGMGAFGVTIRVPVLQGLANMVVGFVLGLGMVYLVAMIANALAPRFGGSSNLPSAFKLVAYGATAALVGGVFQIIPMLGILGVIASIYSIYLLYLGVPLLAGVPKERSKGYTAVLVICAVVLSLLLGWVVSLFTPGLPGGVASRGDMEMTLPGTNKRVNISEMEAITKRLENAGKTGNAADQGKAMGELLSAIAGAQIGAALKNAQTDNAPRSADTPRGATGTGDAASQSAAVESSATRSRTAGTQPTTENERAMEALADRMKALEVRMQAAQKKGDQAAARAVIQEMTGLAQDPAFLAAMQGLQEGLQEGLQQRGLAPQQ